MFNAGVFPRPVVWNMLVKKNMEWKTFHFSWLTGSGANMADNGEFYIDITNCAKSSIKWFYDAILGIFTLRQFRLWFLALYLVSCPTPHFFFCPICFLWFGWSCANVGVPYSEHLLRWLLTIDRQQLNYLPNITAYLIFLFKHILINKRVLLWWLSLYEY